MKNGEVVDGVGTVPVELGERVVLTIVSDVADELHVHGYEIVRQIEPGEPVTIEFVAGIPGQFAAELHDTHMTILELQVR